MVLLCGTLKSTGTVSLLVDTPNPVLNILSNDSCSIMVSSPTTYESAPFFVFITSNGLSRFTNSTKSPQPKYAACIRHFDIKSECSSGGESIVVHIFPHFTNSTKSPRPKYAACIRHFHIKSECSSGGESIVVHIFPLCKCTTVCTSRILLKPYNVKVSPLHPSHNASIHMSRDIPLLCK